MSDLISVSYTTIKSEATAKGLKYYYTQLLQADGTTTAGYNVYAMSPSYGLEVTITSGSDISDFEANIKPTATSVDASSTAQALSDLSQISAIILPGANSGRSFGYTATSATTSKTVRATTYTPQGSNVQRSVNSTNANDTSAGTGARTIKITYFDASCNGPFTETVTMNGTTAVNTVSTTIALIERIEVLTVGSGGGNAGTIQVWTATGAAGSVWGSIAVSDNQTYWAHHYVPVNKTCYITKVEGSASVTAGGLTINYVNPISSAFPQLAPDITCRHSTTNVSREYVVPIAVSGPAIIFINEKPDAATASTTFASFGWIQQ